MHRFRFHFIHLIIPLLFLSACTKNKDEKTIDPAGGFVWKDNLETADVPEHPLRGFLSGREIQFEYVNFERWRGSNDNVLNFSTVKPSQLCGFNEGFQGFRLSKKGQHMEEGIWTKGTFGSESGSYESYFRFKKPDGTFYRSSSPWNCSLTIESITEERAKGKIAICFNDDSKSWIAGNFEAIICNN